MEDDENFWADDPYYDSYVEDYSHEEEDSRDTFDYEEWS